MREVLRWLVGVSADALLMAAFRRRPACLDRGVAASAGVTEER